MQSAVWKNSNYVSTDFKPWDAKHHTGGQWKVKGNVSGTMNHQGYAQNNDKLKNESKFVVDVSRSATKPSSSEAEVVMASHASGD